MARKLLMSCKHPVLSKKSPSARQEIIPAVPYHHPPACSLLPSAETPLEEQPRLSRGGSALPCSLPCACAGCWLQPPLLPRLPAACTGGGRARDAAARSDTGRKGQSLSPQRRGGARCRLGMLMVWVLCLAPLQQRSPGGLLLLRLKPAGVRGCHGARGAGEFRFVAQLIRLQESSCKHPKLCPLGWLLWV